MKGKIAMIDIKSIEFNAEKVIVYEVDDKVILLNTLKTRWCRLTLKEYELYKKFLKDGEEIPEMLIIKLLVHGIVSFKNGISVPEETMAAAKSLPLTVYFEPTPYCNLSCVYCYAEAVEPECLKYETQKSKETLDKIMAHPRLDTIVFTGGEPLLRKDTLDLAEYVVQKGYEASILTNGLFINEKNVNRFRCFTGVTISLDAHIKELHDKTRGKGTFDRVIKSVKLLRAEGIEVTLTSVISKVNSKYVKEIMDYVEMELDVKKHNMSTHISMGRGSEGCIECSTEEVLAYRKTYFNHLCKKGIKEIQTFIRPTIIQGQIRKACGAGLVEAFIKNDGKVYPCRLLVSDEYMVGDISNSSLKDVLESEATHKIRGLFNVENIEDCKNCSHKYICGGGCRSSHFAYTGDVNKSATNLCTLLKSELDASIIIENGYNPVTGRKLKHVV